MTPCCVLARQAVTCSMLRSQTCLAFTWTFNRKAVCVLFTHRQLRCTGALKCTVSCCQEWQSSCHCWPFQYVLCTNRLLDLASSSTEEELKQGKVAIQGVQLLHKYLSPIACNIQCYLLGTYPSALHSDGIGVVQQPCYTIGTCKTVSNCCTLLKHSAGLTSYAEPLSLNTTRQ